MNQKLRIPAFLMIATFFFTACSKNDKPSKTPSQLIGSGTAWKFSKATSGGVDIGGVITACIKDNLITFFDAALVKTGNVNEGASKCNPADPQTTDFIWTYDSGTRALEFTATGTISIIPGGSNKFNVVSVSETKLVLSQLVPTTGGASQLVEVTMVH